MRTTVARHWRLPTRVSVVFAATLAVVAVLIAQAVPPAAAQPSAGPPTAASSSQPAGQPAGEPVARPEQHPVRRLCDHPQPGQAACLALVRTDVAAHTVTPSVADPAGYTPADLRDAYALPSQTAGAGQTVAVVAAYDNPVVESDLAAYRAQFGLPACTVDNGCFRKVDQRGGTDFPPPHPGWAGEIALDVEMISAVCPLCHILLVEGDDAFPDSLGEAVDTAVRLGAKYVSNSYGTDGESAAEGSFEHYYDHPGVVITASTGDHGLGVSYPAASPHVTAVGGTSLVPDDNTRGWAESAWSGAGSGCSQYLAKPAFQTDSLCPRRTIADVSAVADPDTGVAVYNTFQAPGWDVYGGTSASAPIVAAVYALAAQPGATDYPNSYPYANPAGFHDVTSGSNGACGGSYLCTGVTGYDGPTGLGTPSGILGFLPPGPRGTVTGTVSTAGTGTPIAGAQVSVGTAVATTDADGHYAVSVPAGSYDITASAFGYQDTTVPGVSVVNGQTVTRDLALTRRQSVTVSGVVHDGSGHGWPLHARIDVDNGPSQPIYTDPYSGRYSVELPSDADYTLHVTADLPGYQPVTRTVHTGAADLTEDVSVPVDAAACVAPGYGFTIAGIGSTFDGTTAPDGWTVTDNTGNGSWVFDDPGQRGNRTGGSGGFAIFDGAFLPHFIDFDSELITPVADLSDVAAPVLTLNMDYVATTNAVGDIDLSLDGGTTWSNIWHARGGYRTFAEHIDLPQAAHQPNARVRFHYRTFNTGWWQIDDVVFGERRCTPQTGGLLVGTVTDANTGQPLDGAAVMSVDRPGERTLTGPTPADPNLPDGFYTMFSSLVGQHPFRASRLAYTATTRTVNVAPDWVNQVDFALAGGHLVLSTDTVGATQRMGAATTKTVTFRNDGGSPVRVNLHEDGAGFSLLATGGAPVQRVSGTFTPGRLVPGKAGQAAPTAAPAAVSPQTPPWTGIANYPSPIMDNAVATGPDGTVYSVGGTNGFQSFNTGYAFHPDTGSWTPIAAMGSDRQKPAAAFVNGMLYVTGGWAINGLPVPTLEIYNPNTDTWSTGADVPTPLAAPAVAVLDDTIYLVGGCDFSVCGHREVLAYHPGTDTWQRLADYPRPISWASCGGVGARLYCAGGVTDAGSTRSAYVYDPATDAWAPIASMPIDLYASGYTAANGRLLVSGGSTAGGSVITNQGFGYDPAADAWSPIPNSNTATYRGGSACGFYKVGGSVGGFSPVPAGEVLPGFGQCGTSADVDWLSASPESFTVEPGKRVKVTVTLDAGAESVSQPGDYLARLRVDNDSPYPVAIDVTMTANPPKSWGKITGVVTGVRCDGSTVALPGATVAIDTWANSYTLRTDVEGRYALWLDRRNNPLTVIAARDGWRPQVTTVRIKAKKTTTVDFALTTTATC